MIFNIVCTHHVQEPGLSGQPGRVLSPAPLAGLDLCYINGARMCVSADRILWSRSSVDSAGWCKHHLPPGQGEGRDVCSKLCLLSAYSILLRLNNSAYFELLLCPPASSSSSSSHSPRPPSLPPPCLPPPLSPPSLSPPVASGDDPVSWHCLPSLQKLCQCWLAD